MQYIMLIISSLSFLATGNQEDIMKRTVKDQGNFYNYLLEDHQITRITMDANRLPLETTTLPFREPVVSMEQRITTPCGDHSPEWSYSLFGSGIGDGGLLLHDFNNNGYPEVILGGNSHNGFGLANFWHVLEWNGDRLVQRNTSPIYDATITKIFFFDYQTGGSPELGIALSDATILFYQVEDMTLLGTVQLDGLQYISDLAIADVDLDDTQEFVISDGENLIVYSAQSPYLQERRFEGKAGSRLAVGNVDTDPALELIAEGTDGRGYVFDGISGAIEWDYALGFGFHLAVADIDGDQIDEIIGAERWYALHAFDADVKIEKWNYRTNHDIHTLMIADSNKDGTLDVIYGDAQWGSIYGLDGTTNELLWSQRNPEHGITETALGDINGDGNLDLLWGAGHTSTGPDHLFAADLTLNRIIWQSLNLEGPISPLAYGDLDGNGNMELITSSQDGILLTFDATNRTLQSEGSGLGIYTWSGVGSIEIADVDGDQVMEYVIATAAGYDGHLRVYNGVTHELEWASEGINGVSFTKAVIEDLDGNGSLEILVGEQVEHTGASGARIHIYAGANGEKLWTSPYLLNGFGRVSDVLVTDLDGDSVKEIIAATTNGVFIFDSATYQLKGDISISALSLASYEAEGMVKLLVGDSSGDLSIYDSVTLELESNIDAFNSSFSALGIITIYDVDYWVLVSQSQIKVLDVTQHTTVWETGSCYDQLGRFNSLVIEDLDKNGLSEITLGSRDRLLIFEPDICTEARLMNGLSQWPEQNILDLIEMICPLP